MNRPYFLEQIAHYFKSHAIVALLGPRQCGKTTLARAYGKQLEGEQEVHYFDLENPIDLERLTNPLLTLKPLSGLIVIDEIQRAPELFTLLRVLVDEESANKQFLILGSASRELIQQTSESLAGRIAYIELTPFTYEETHDLEKIWLRGGFPRSYLANTEEESFDWREFYITTFLEQDIPNLGIKIPATSLRRFWTMLAHYHANILNLSELGRSFGISDPTVRRYLDILSGTFMIRQLQPWQENTKKRQVKAPKIYFRDSGLLHTLARIHDQATLQTYAKLGASWEGFALEQIIQKYHAKPQDCFFWATHNGAELDLLLFIKNQRLGFEIKYSDAPRLTPSMKIALEDLSLDQLTVIYPGNVSYPLADKIQVIGLNEYLKS
jgi:predicted AAA+ superfamily ATPase